jgi:hypothetical protein
VVWGLIQNDDFDMIIITTIIDVMLKMRIRMGWKLRIVVMVHRWDGGKNNNSNDDDGLSDSPDIGIIIRRTRMTTIVIVRVFSIPYDPIQQQEVL